MAETIPTSFQIGAKTDPNTAAQRYKDGASAKGAKWAARYLSSKVDPFNAAAAAAGHRSRVAPAAAHRPADRMIARINEVGAAGVRAGLARVNRDRVAKNVNTNGPTRYAQGIANKGADNYASSAQSLIPALQQAAANLPPRGTDADNDNRMLQMVAAARKLRGQARSK